MSSSGQNRNLNAEENVPSSSMAKRKSGNSNIKFEKRKKVLKMRDDIKDDLHFLLEAEDGESPLILIELSKKEWKRYQPTSICLSGITSFVPENHNILHRQIYYDTVEMGNKIQNKNDDIIISNKTMTMNESNSTINVDVINYTNIKGAMIAIVTTKDEIKKEFKNVLLMTSNLTPVTNRNSTFQSSNKVLLFIIRHNNSQKDPECSQFNDSLMNTLKKTKPNICKKDGTNNHFNSQGYISAWGNKALFGKSSEKSSVGQYVKRKPKKETMILEVKHNNDILENLVSNEVSLATSKFNKWLPNLKQLIAPILNVAFEKQQEDGNINFKMSTTSQHGLWQSELCCNAITKDFHTEKDITYTLISVPYQQHDNPKKKKPRDSIFLFKINETKILGFKLFQKCSFIFNGTMLTHRQFSEDGYENEEYRNGVSNFYNVACYGNQRLYNHLRKSFRRELGIED